MIESAGIPPEQTQALHVVLLPGEKVLWTGRPDPRRLVSRADLFLIPFSVMWGGFAIFWELAVLGVIDFGDAGSGDAAPWFFALWGIPFVVAGLYLIAGRFLVKRWVRRRTVYAVTDQRVVVMRRVRGARVDTGYIHSLPNVTASVDASGRGTIDFRSGDGGTFGSRAFANPWATGMSGLVFDEVPNAHEALAFINSVRGRAGR